MRNEISGSLLIERYSDFTLPDNVLFYEPETIVTAKKGYFKYESEPESNEWHMNFADKYLFGCYGNFLFAQDEIQVAEHPCLASIREMMLSRDDDLRPFTVEENRPTPVLIRGVQRTVNINTRSIYGAQFARSDDLLIRESITKISPPTVSNILAIEAPRPSENNYYDSEEIRFALQTAYSGFRAVVVNSNLKGESKNRTVLHTGNWGCGAYGGNRQLMIVLQIMAAKLAGASEIVFHCGSDSTADIERWQKEISSKWKFRSGASVNKVLRKLTATNFPWGASDGN